MNHSLGCSGDLRVMSILINLWFYLWKKRFSILSSVSAQFNFLLKRSMTKGMFCSLHKTRCQILCSMQLLCVSKILTPYRKLKKASHQSLLWADTEVSEKRNIFVHRSAGRHNLRNFLAANPTQKYFLIARRLLFLWHSRQKCRI